MKAMTIFLIVCGALLFVPLFFVLASVIAYHGSGDVMTEFTMELSEEQAVELMSQRVVQDYHYQEFGGHDLQLIGLSRPEPERCKGLWRDYFGSDARYASCYEGLFTFSVNESAPAQVRSYTVRTWLLGDEIKGFEISERPVFVMDFESCVLAGNEVLFDDGVRARCRARDGEVFVGVMADADE